MSWKDKYPELSDGTPAAMLFLEEYPEANAQFHWAFDVAVQLEDLAGSEETITTADDLLDALACAGLKLAPGDGEASVAYILTRGITARSRIRGEIENR